MGLINECEVYDKKHVSLGSSISAAMKHSVLSKKLALAYFVEMLGTFLLVLIMIYGSVTKSIFIPITTGASVSALTYAFHSTSGSHMNPAVSWAMWVVYPKNLDAFASTIYVTIQYLSGSAAAFACFFLVRDTFYFHPLPGYSTSQAFAVETICTSIVCASALYNFKCERDAKLRARNDTKSVEWDGMTNKRAAGRDKSRAVRSAYQGVATMIAMAFSFRVSGACLNPAAYWGAVSAHIWFKGYDSVDWIKCIPYYVGPYTAATIVGLLNRSKCSSSAANAVEPDMFSSSLSEGTAEVQEIPSEDIEHAKRDKHPMKEKVPLLTSVFKD